MIACRKTRAPKSRFDRRSFRWSEKRPCKHGICRHLYACPAGSWMPRKEKCKTTMAIYESITMTRGRKCPDGYVPK